MQTQQQSNKFRYEMRQMTHVVLYEVFRRGSPDVVATVYQAGDADRITFLLNAHGEIYGKTT